MLAGLGAEIIKIESPHRGDDSRHWGLPFAGADSTYFLAVNRNKRSVALNLKSAAGRDTALRLVAMADIMVENWRPGTAARLGLDPHVLRLGQYYGRPPASIPAPCPLPGSSRL